MQSKSSTIEQWGETRKVFDRQTKLVNAGTQRTAWIDHHVVKR